MSTPLVEARRKMDAIHTEMARLKKAVQRLGARKNPDWADVGDMGQVLEYITVAAEFALLKHGIVDGWSPS